MSPKNVGTTDNIVAGIPVIFASSKTVLTVGIALAYKPQMYF